MENSDRNSVEFQQFLFQIRLIQNENFNIYTVFTFSQDLKLNLQFGTIS
jgi:hypothetical protein